MDAPASPPPATDASADRLTLSTARQDPAWDRFLQQSGASHTQSALWGEVKAALGWRAARVVARRGDTIVGGAQLLIRPVAGLGAIGYVANGPVLAADDPALVGAVLTGLRRAARRLRVQHTTIQPPLHGDALARTMRERGYLVSTTRVTPPASVLLDCTVGRDTLLAAMNPRTRYNVQLGARRGVVVREGDSDDLDVFARLLEATARRQRFTALPGDYFRTMWEILQPYGHVRLTLAEYDSEVVAAQLAVVFGGTVTNKMSVWSGRHGKHRPNEALQWATIQWAAEQGHRWYDLEGIDVKAARAVLAGRPLPERAHQSVTSYKLGFGGRVVVLPDAYDDLYNPLLRTAYGWTYPLVRDRRAVRRLVKQVRSRPRRPSAPAPS
ncbi:lipid II:glycine glycyltransferase FemX [Egicoccus sp. AB-alg2]|uniref:lipid II:glycine glycyltransferase FemX n=1 Tax=Egicoccus sp. AB-alg2 TaxID=3242693 RepID=UPI00359E940C